MAEAGSANVRITADDSQARKTVSGFFGFLKKSSSIAAGVVGGLAVFDTIKSTFSGLSTATIGANADMETYQNTLAVVLKSSEKATKMLEWANKFAADTPFEIPDIVEATTKLETYGISAKATLGDIGDMAAVTGKPLMQAVEAVADA
jgi:phage tail tape-measure protein